MQALSQKFCRGRRFVSREGVGLEFPELFDRESVVVTTILRCVYS
jgi:hypothetical protein